MKTTGALSRRSLLQAVLAPAVIRGHGQIKPPVPVPVVTVVRHDGFSATLPSLVAGYATAVQLMFTACTTTCPMEAAIFQRVQKTVPGMLARRIQLLSLSVDPENDTPKALSAWRRRFHAGHCWIAAAPAIADRLQARDFFQKGSDSSDHSTQVHILDRNGCLVWRTFELPRPEEIASVLTQI
jgi:protein SCO1/2